MVSNSKVRVAMHSRCYGLLCVAFMVLSVGCTPGTNNSTSPAQPAESGKKILRIAVIPKGTSHEFWKSVHAGAAQAAKELGDVEILWDGPAAESDINKQIDIVRGMIVNKVDGICLAPNHSESLVDAVKEANQAKIPTLVFDSGLAQGAEILSYVATDNEHGGELAAERLAEVLQQKGNVILMRYRVGSESTEMREQGFLKKMATYPSIKILSDNQYGEATTESAKEKAQQLLIQFEGEVDGVFAVCEPNCVGMLQALDAAGVAGKVKFVAFDPSEQLLAGLENGQVHGIVLQDPVRMGYLSVKTIVQHLRGEKVPARVATGEHVATKENMQTPEYVKLLKPVQQE
jgi:ribose transport system substrate-binding protein